MSREWKKISWEELDKDRDYNVYINNHLAGRIYRTSINWKVELYFKAQVTDIWGNVNTLTNIRETFKDRFEAKEKLVELWKLQDIDNDIDLSIDSIEDTQPDIISPFPYKKKRLRYNNIP